MLLVAGQEEKVPAGNAQKCSNPVEIAPEHNAETGSSVALHLLLLVQPVDVSWSSETSSSLNVSGSAPANQYLLQPLSKFSIANGRVSRIPAASHFAGSTPITEHSTARLAAFITAEALDRPPQRHDGAFFPAISSSRALFCNCTWIAGNFTLAACIFAPWQHQRRSRGAADKRPRGDRTRHRWRSRIPCLCAHAGAARGLAANLKIRQPQSPEALARPFSLSRFQGVRAFKPRGRFDPQGMCCRRPPRGRLRRQRRGTRRPSAVSSTR